VLLQTLFGLILISRKVTCLPHAKLVFSFDFVVLVKKFVSQIGCPFDAARAHFQSSKKNGKGGAKVRIKVACRCHMFLFSAKVRSTFSVVFYDKRTTDCSEI